MSIIRSSLLLGAGAAAGGYQIERSIRFNSSDSGYLSRTPAVAGNRQTWTWAGWVKRSAISGEVPLFHTPGSSNSAYFRIYITSDQLSFTTLNFSGGIAIGAVTTQVFRDPSSWMHFVVAFDTTQATASDRLKLYVNGSQVTQFSSSNWPTQNTDYGINTSGLIHYIGLRTDDTRYADGYLADIHFIDGQALTPSSFTEVSATTGQLVPKAYSGSYGTNGFKLTFSDNSNNTATTLGKDTSGNGNNWTPNNLSVTAGAGNDSLVDTPTSYGTDDSLGGSVRGNYATLNPLNVQLGAGSLSNGNLDLTGPSGSSAYNYAGGTFGIDTSTSTGWYFEFTQTTYGQFASVALLDQSVSASSLNNLYIIGHSFANQTAGISYTNAGALGNYGTLTTGLTTWASSGDVIGVAIKDNKIWFAKNNTWISGSPTAGTSPSITLASTKYVTPAAIGINSSVLSLNAGQRPFAYTAPSGFKALCDTNLPAPVVAKPNTVMDVVLYTGTGSALTPTSSLAFNPDWIWIKSRSAATDHALYDVVRGATIDLVSNSTAAETTQTQGLTAFNSNGFSVGTLAKVNTSSATYAAWCWDAGTSTVTNTQGSITSSVRANASAGFSVVTYTVGNNTSQTIGHGLNVAPQLIIVKERNQVNNWQVYHASLGNGSFLYLNATNASGSNNLWNNTSPTSTVFSIRSGGSANFYDGKDHVAYCFAPVAGYSSFGSYTGNGSADGPFVFCNFRPRFLLVKRSDASGEPWIIHDSVRDSYNGYSVELYPNNSNAEGGPYSPPVFDFLSNGFKIRSGGATAVNASGGTFIFMALAESPFAYSRAR